MKVGVTFAVYNNCNHTRKCLRSIYENGSKNIHVVVVNNGSKDNTLGMIKSEFPEVKVINNEKNKGCSFAWNQGLRDCLSEGCDYLILTQNDVLISKGLIDNCVEFLEKEKDAQIVSPYVINVSCDSSFSISQEKLDVFSKRAIDNYGDSRMESFCFYFFMMRPEVFKKIKFDETFRKAQYEDSDFYFNVRLNSMTTCHSLSVGVVYHRFGTTQKIANFSDPGGNKKYFENKWNGKRKKVQEGRLNSMRLMNYKNICPIKGTFINIENEKIKELMS